MAERLNVYIGEPLARLLTDHGEARSARINSAAERYLAIIDDIAARLPFTRGEWCAICDAGNGLAMMESAAWHYIWAEIADARGLAAKWHVDQDALAQRVRALSIAERVAMIELIERFWQRADLPTDVAMERAGIVPTDRRP